MLGTNLNIRTYIGYFELFGERTPLREIKKRLRAFKLSNLVGELARINTLLTISLHDDKKREDEEVRERSEAILSRVRKTIFGSIAMQATP